MAEPRWPALRRRAYEIHSNARGVFSFLRLRLVSLVTDGGVAIRRAYTRDLGRRKNGRLQSRTHRRADIVQSTLVTEIEDFTAPNRPRAVALKSDVMRKDTAASPPDGGRGGRRATKTGYHKYGRYEYNSRPRQEISRCLKYFLFFVNFIFWICGITCTVLGIYLYAKDFRAVLEAIDFFLNPSILLIACGCIIFFIAFLGCTGALRENVCMLKLFSLCLFFAYICLVILAFVVFILVYTDTKTGVSIQTLLNAGVLKYHDNDNMRELMDYLQANLGCCGASSQGYKDWNMSPLYNCSPSNPTPEQCGVPPSCCKHLDSAVTVPTVVSNVGTTPKGPHGFSPPPPPNILPQESSSQALNPRCGFHTQDKSITDLQNVLYTDGCLQPLQRAFEGNAVIIGAVIGAIIVPVCLSVTFSNVLAKQVERQRYLLDKEARREDRRRRRNRSKFRDPFANTLGAEAEMRVHRHAIDSGVVIQLEPISSASANPGPIVKENPVKIIMEEHHAAMLETPMQQQQTAFQQPPRKRSNNTDLPPIPQTTGASKMHDAPPGRARRRHKEKSENKSAGGHKERRSSVGVAAHKYGKHEAEKRRNKAHKNTQQMHRSRSEDPNVSHYSGPIIVELSSVTHEGPPQTSESPRLVENSSQALLIEHELPQRRNSNNKIDGVISE